MKRKTIKNKRFPNIFEEGGVLLNYLEDAITNANIKDSDALSLIGDYGNTLFVGRDYDTLASEWGLGNVGNVHSDIHMYKVNGWKSFWKSINPFSKDTPKNREIKFNEALDEANIKRFANLNNAIRLIQDREKIEGIQKMMAFGGPYYIDGAINYDLAQKGLENKRLDALSKNKITALPASGSTESVNVFDKGGKIHIKPSKRGTFTAAAKKRGMGVQAFASKVLANKENYSPAMVKKANFARNASKWKHAFGGELEGNGSLFDLGYNNIGNGDTHENNIYGGVPVGVDSQGIPNLVEQGEVIWKDKNYVFSDRLINPETGNTFAKDAKKAQQEIKERPNDAISKRGLDTTYTKLANSQEAIREQVEPSKKNTYDIGGVLMAMRGLSTIPSIIGLLNPPKAGSYKVPRTRNVSYTPLGDLLTYTPFDTDYRTAQLMSEAAATRRALSNSGGIGLTGLLAANYNTMLGLGDLYKKEAESNLAQRQAVAQFNRGTRYSNQEARLKAELANQQKDLTEAQLEIDALKYAQDQLDKVYAAKMGNWSNLFTNLSRIGQDYLNQYDAILVAKYLPGGSHMKFGDYEIFRD